MSSWKGPSEATYVLTPAQIECQTWSFERNASSGRIVACPLGRLVADPDSAGLGAAFRRDAIKWLACETLLL